MAYEPQAGDVLSLSSTRSTAFAGPYAATVERVVPMMTGDAGIVIRTKAKIRFGPEPSAMHEANRFLLLARGAEQSIHGLAPGEPLPVYITTTPDWQIIDNPPLNPRDLAVEAWGDLALPSEPQTP